MLLSAALENLIRQIGDVGLRLREIDAAEGRAGNISATLGPEHLPGLPSEPDTETVALPGRYPLLAGVHLLVTGSGRRLWQIRDDPEGTLCLVRIGADGAAGELLWGKKRGLRPTSELNSHLAVHQVRREIGQPASVVIHAQPLHVTALSHAAGYEQPEAFNRALFRWQPETIVLMPEGIGLIPYELPGSQEQAAATAEAFRSHRLVVWARHGVVSIGPDAWSAFDLVDCAEIAARYFYVNRAAGIETPGLSARQLQQLCDKFKVKSPMVEAWLKLE
ncbi:MAG: rhamnulose-1-phosphate aldolase [Planctomycetes bacterium]|nr:rhamnulose-1-phosphate aldolase [Planctomycetota bacterium]